MTIEGCIVINWLPNGRVQLKDLTGRIFSAHLVIDAMGVMHIAS